MVTVESATGLDAVADLLIAQQEVCEIELLRIALPPAIEHRPGATAAMIRYADAARAAKTAGDSFTETLVAVAQSHGDTASALAVIGYHQPLANARERTIVRRADITPRLLRELASNVEDDEMLVLTSRVTVSDGFAHIPMLDMKLASSDANDPVAIEVARLLGGGLLLRSGSSYHLYGNGLLCEKLFTEWLLKAQLLSRCVDTRWVTHQLLEQRAALRLSRGGRFHRELTVVARVPSSPRHL